MASHHDDDDEDDGNYGECLCVSLYHNAVDEGQTRQRQSASPYYSAHRKGE